LNGERPQIVTFPYQSHPQYAAMNSEHCYICETTDIDGKPSTFGNLQVTLCDDCLLRITDRVADILKDYRSDYL
jgi:hypothetical protein